MICITAECTRHCRGAACRSRRSACDTNRLPIKRHAPIASVAAVTAQPLAALPPYGCGVPLAGSDRLVQSHSTAGGHWCTAALPDVSLRGAKRRGNLGEAVAARTSHRRPHALPNLTVAALPAQPLAALPPYGCGVPFTGSDRHWHSQISGRLADRTGFQIWKPCAIKSIPQKLPACMALIEFRCRPIVQFSRFTP